MANEEHLAKLEEGVEAWNKWRRKNPDIKPDLEETFLEDANLQCAFLESANLKGAFLNGAFLNGAFLHGASLNKASLERANFKGAKLESINLENVYLYHINLSDERLESANLRGANLRSANLRSVNLSDTNLSGANLSNADLSSTNLSGANLSNVDLSSTNLSGANLSNADLSSTNLSGVDLSNVDLSGANLSNVDLSGTNLSGADLSFTKLYGANLKSANLNNVKLSGAALSHLQPAGFLTDEEIFAADLSNADLSNADLSDAYLSDVNLYNANLSGANLSGANLHNANLFGINLYGAKLERENLLIARSRGVKLEGINLTNVKLEGINLTNTNLKDAILSDADLKKVQALGTDFQGATLTGSCIEDWNINSKTNLKNVKCEYIYLKSIYSEEKQKWIFTDRVPHDPDKIFAPGEFTRRYQKILETVNLYFGEGIDWQVFLNSFQRLQEEEKIKIADGEREIPIVQGIENTGDGSFVIKIGVSPDTDKGEIEKSFWQKYQIMLDEVEEKYRAELNFKDEQIQFYRQNYTQVLDIIKLTASQTINITQQQGENNMSEKRDIKIEKGNYNENIEGNYYEQQGNFGIGHMSGGTISGNAKVAGVINEAAPQDLAQAAAEIQQLLGQLSKTYPTENTLEQMTVGVKLAEEIKNNPTRWQKVINVIKAMGIEAVAEAVDNPIFNIAKAGIEAALESES